MTQNIIFRFTLGKTHEDGKNMLLLSIRRLKRLYPEAKIVVCYNNVDDLNNIEKLNITFFSNVEEILQFIKNRIMEKSLY